MDDETLASHQDEIKHVGLSGARILHFLSKLESHEWMSSYTLSRSIGYSHLRVHDVLMQLKDKDLINMRETDPPTLGFGVEVQLKIKN